MNASLLREFKQPGSPYRGAPFWAWNGKLDPAELRRQVRLMKRMGLGGFFMHARVGLKTGYLSEEWFECVKACVDEAKRQGMNAWLYDEDCWPSGTAGGIVTRNPRHHMHRLVMEEVSDVRALRRCQNVLAVFTARVSGATAADVRQVPRGGKPPALKPGESWLVFRVEEDGSYVDTLSHEAVARFIEVTHEAYKKNVARDFGGSIPGIFSDEPRFAGLAADHKDGTLISAWTGALPAVFRKRYGYDLVAHLPELFLDLEGQPVSRARYHYIDCVTHLFTEAFFRQIGDWCGANGLSFTGHVMDEDWLSCQVNAVGSCMRCYEHMQAPGMDLLTEVSRMAYDTAKQVSSVARQFGRKWRLTETYGCTGWDFPFAGHKALGDWQFALGINLRCQHLAWYTMLGQAKRDFPASISYQSPWWDLYPKVEDYFGRIAAVMTRGAEVRDLLVLHANESMWLLVGKGWRTKRSVKDMEVMVAQMRDTLFTHSIDFDYGDEELLSRHGKTVRRDGRPVFRMAKAEYKAVLVPPLLTMRATTLQRLKAFHEQGGLVVFAGEPPANVDAVASDAVAEFARTCISTQPAGEELIRAVAPACRRVSVHDGSGDRIAPALHLLREDADNFYLFICNTGHDRTQFTAAHQGGPVLRECRAGFAQAVISVHLDTAGVPLELDPETGSIYSADAQRWEAGWRISTSLPPLASRLYVLPKKAGADAFPRRPRLTPVSVTPLAPVSWRVSLSEDNLLVLDRAAFRIGDKEWQDREEILRIGTLVRQACGTPRRSGKKPGKSAATTPVALAYSFEVAQIPSGAMHLAVERPELFTIALNGVPLDMDSECGWWCDRSLRKIPFRPSLLRTGWNEVTMTCAYGAGHSGLETAYLLGNFSVNLKNEMKDAEIGAPVSTLRCGDWVEQGLPFYSGHVAYLETIHPELKPGERLFVEVPAYRGVAVRIGVNGRDAGIIAWEPNELDITDLVGDGPAQLMLEVIGHRRNSHGPLHNSVKSPHWTGPSQFTSTGNDWVDHYQLVPCGLMEPPRLVVKD